MWLDVFQQTDGIIFYIFAAVSALILVLCFTLAILGCVLKTGIPGGSMDFYIAVGSLAMVTTVLIRGVDPSWAHEASQILNNNFNISLTPIEELNIACQFYPVILVVGMVWLIGGVTIRCCALFGFYLREIKSSRRYEWIPNLFMVLVTLAFSVAVIVWLCVYDIRISKRVAEEVYICTDDEVHDNWQIGLSAALGVLLLIGAIMIWPAIHHTRHTVHAGDANVMAVIVYNIVFVVIAGALLRFMYYDNTTASGAYAISGGLILYAVLSTVLILNIARIMAARRYRDNYEGNYNEVED